MEEEHITEKRESSDSSARRNNSMMKKVQSKGPQFYPALYIQRYNLVQKLLQDHKIKSVVDFGSAECKIVHWLKRVETVEKICLVDVDTSILQANAHIIQPLIWECAIPRSCPLTITVLAGSADVVDSRIMGCEAATLIEVIEHLEPNVLAHVIQAVFGNLRPSLVVITTPNADFNILFPDFTGFRHWDHKFEWTQEEFHCWCKQICEDYKYKVTFTGVGKPPEGKEDLGYCSQVAVLTNESDYPNDCVAEFVYSQILEHVYHVDTRSYQEKLIQEVTYVVNSLLMIEQQELGKEDQEETVCISIEKIIGQLSRQHKEWQAQDIMSIFNFGMLHRTCVEKLYTLSDSRQYVLIPVNSCDTSSHSSDEYDVESDTDITSQKKQLQWSIEDEKWD
ncbi:small RNA 2'-O-methyltransferase-like isoform X2 [Pomacea canaliculata]|nr:small RNA 2'-O-methyltransferase-like isoform X2 [Pomacea canaliculata]XP_025112496.1 small RNA 2'-O-methyltransferase-like isoform X2 [Pomacea canaliculata]